MTTLFEIAAYATTATLAYKLGISHKDVPSPLLPIGGLASAAHKLAERLDALTPTAPVATPIEEQAPAVVSVASQVPAVSATIGAVAAPPAPVPAPAAEGAGLPDNLSPQQAREELKKELGAMNVDAIRAQARKLDPAKRELFKAVVPNLEKARKDQLITAMVKAFGL